MGKRKNYKFMNVQLCYRSIANLTGDRLHISKTLYVLMGEPKYISLSVDTKNKAICLEPNHTGVYRVTDSVVRRNSIGKDSLGKKYTATSIYSNNLPKLIGTGKMSLDFRSSGQDKYILVFTDNQKIKAAGSDDNKQDAQEGLLDSE